MGNIFKAPLAGLILLTIPTIAGLNLVIQDFEEDKKAKQLTTANFLGLGGARILIIALLIVNIILFYKLHLFALIYLICFSLLSLLATFNPKKTRLLLAVGNTIVIVILISIAVGTKIVSVIKSF